MNQILVCKNDNYLYNNLIIQNNKRKKIFCIVFVLSISICIIILFYLLYSYFSKIKQEEKTSTLKNKYNVSTLYSSNSNYTAIKLNNEISIIGLIEIPKLNISYPILENSNKNLLKISVCKFSGPLPNRIGNLCIAGHNYKNNMMFSNLYNLQLGDSIFITDLNNTRLEYVVYDKFKVKQNNLTCTENTNYIEVTLITCNSNNNSERIVIKAKVKG